MKRRIAVDASVLVKLVIPEARSESALGLARLGCSLVVPDLFYPEAANVLWKKASRGEIEASEAILLFRRLRQLNISVLPSRSLSALALEIALEYRQTAYDSIYLAAALRAGVPLVTADAALFRSMRKGALGGSLIWIGNAAESLA